MENRSGVSLKENIVLDKDYSKALEGLRSLDRQLEYLHGNNYYVTKLDADSVVYTDCYGFKDIAKVDPKNREQLMLQNIKDLVKLSLGVFVSLDTDGNIFYDYTKLDDKFISDNYPYGIRPSIKYGTDYYDNIIYSELFGGFEPINKLYFNQSLEDTANMHNSRGNSVTKIKSTPAGRALSEKQDAAFVKIVFFPVIVICVLLSVFVIYMLYAYL